MSDHLRKTKLGVFWSFANQGGNQIFSLLVTFILARLISPEEFGTIGMITVFTGFAAIFVNFGFSQALIQKKDVSSKDINTVFVFNLTSGLILTLLFFLIAPFISDFYDKPILEKLTKALSPIFLISSISGVNRALNSKEMNFKLSTIISIISLVLSSSLTIIMAYYGYGVWSILVKMLSSQAIVTILYLIYKPVKQRLLFNKQSFNSMFRMGSNVAGDSMINYWSRNADNLLIAKMLGDSSLGIYSKSYSIMLLPLTNISRVISRVMFPSFSIIQNDIKKLRSIYLKTTKLIAFVTFPMMIGLMLVAEPFVLVAFGKDWIAMVPIISILSVLGATQSILSLNGVIYNALGKAHLAFRVSLVYNIINIIGFYVGIKINGLVGLASLYTALGLIGTIPNFYIAGRQIGVSVKSMFGNLSGTFLNTLIMAVFILAVKYIINPFELSPFFELLILVFVGAIVYIITSLLLKMEEASLLKNLVKKKK
ncbi:MOP flippase family protein [Gramella sp. BOM4]|nr:MOP flippase family protein [Christiangramia bathymodioli]